jgi:hypothetical protein
MRKPQTIVVVLLMCVLALIVSAGGAAAQDGRPVVTIAWIDSQALPSVQAYVTVADAGGSPVLGLTADDFVAFEDGVRVPPGSVAVGSESQQPLRQ